MVGRKELERKCSKSGDKANMHARGFRWGWMCVYVDIDAMFV
jgi:hypothetical protein